MLMNASSTKASGTYRRVPGEKYCTPWTEDGGNAAGTTAEKCQDLCDAVHDACEDKGEYVRLGYNEVNGPVSKMRPLMAMCVLLRSLLIGGPHARITSLARLMSMCKNFWRPRKNLSVDVLTLPHSDTSTGSILV